MKKMLFISKNKVLGQGLLAAIKARPELGLEWLPQFSYSEAAIGADVYHADVVILDVMDGAVADQCSATRFLRNRDKKNEKNEGKYLK